MTAPTKAEKADAVLRDIVRLYLELQDSLTQCCDAATSRQCEALLLLADVGDVTVQAFAERMGLEKTWASRLLVRMEKGGFIRRVDNPADQRSLLVKLTAKGRAEQAKLNAGVRERALSLLQCVPAAERTNVERALVHLRDALAKCVAECDQAGSCDP